MISVIATLPVQEGKTDEFEKVFAELADKVKANEPGCQRYELCRSTVNPTTYVVVERYADKEALDHHGKTPYFLEAFGKLGPLLAGAPQIELLKPIG
ncbi:MAG TPA: putative quinol monooxygenase [Candidatus Binatia bacterium]